MNEIENLEDLSEKELISDLLDIPEEEIRCSRIIDILRSPMGVCNKMNSRRRKRILAAGEFARRLLKGPSHRKVTMRSPSDLIEILMPRLRYETQEIFMAVALDNKWNVLAVREIAKGSCDKVSISNRDIFREMLKYPVQDIVLVHNHPNGDPEPSEGDIGFTDTAIYCGAVLGLRVIDSIIIGDGTFVSLRERDVCVFKKVEEDAKKGAYQGL